MCYILERYGILGTYNRFQLSIAFLKVFDGTGQILFAILWDSNNNEY